MTAKRPDPKSDQFRIAASSISTKDLAGILGVTPDAISKLHRAGVIRQNGKVRGKYDLVETVNTYLDYLRENKGSDAADRLKVEQERKIRLQNDRAEKDLVKTVDALEVFAVASTCWRDIVSALPKRVARRVANSDSPDEIRMILRDELDGLYWEFKKGLGLP